jgi:NhaP-type Na+/H+ or K+/H+ antiporter
MTEHHPTFFLAALVAVMAAVALRLLGVPAPWPAAIAMYVYGTVAWPVLRERMPVKPTLYAAVWVSVALLVVAYETLGAYGGSR